MLFTEFAVEDPFDDLVRLLDFLLLLGEARLGDGAMGVGAFLHADPPVLDRSATKAVVGAPTDVLGDGLQTEELEVRQQVMIKFFANRLLRLANRIAVSHS